MRAPRRRACKLDVVVETAPWDEHRALRLLLRRAVDAAAAELSTSGAELAIVLTDDSAIRVLNRKWRGIDAPTNVLSFPADVPAGAPPLLGDIVLAYDTVAREAQRDGKPFAHHVAHLAVHGFLHLCGYDHERDSDAETMEQLERTILRRLDIPDPYRVKRQPTRPHAKPARRKRQTRRRMTEKR
ncbi:MAG TPA: rRNA maturation RNase YbeY [Xanthobacteraceae bacterium]|jgi:probable rRNA maturation factor|nr:rRNA maturation RNase YbeY [Xanthobacteraceae bacterium]